MATTNKDFRVKSGLVVEGATSTVNGNQVLTTASSLDSLSDVVITTPATSQVLSYNGTNWVNSSSAGGGTTTNALTIGTGLSGTSFNGSAAVTIANTGVLSVNGSTGTITGIATLASPTFTGTPLSTTAAADTNTTQIATTAFVVGQASSSNPTSLGSVAVGTSLKYARADHVHPTTGLATSGANSNITSLTGLTTALSVAQGGTGITSFASGIATFLGTSTSANLAAAVTDETGSGSLVFGTSPTIGTPTITSPTVTGLTLNDSSIVFEGATADLFETTLTVVDPTADRTITLPDVTGTVVTTGDTGTVTSTMIADGTIVNADINSAAAIAVSKLAASTISGVTLGSNLNSLTISTGLSGTSYNGSSSVIIAIDSTVATLTGIQTLTNKTINLTSNTLTGTIAQFNTALSDADFATLAGTETLTNKTVSVDNNTVSGITASSFVLSDASGNIDGSAAQKVIPSGTVVGTSDSQTLTNKTLGSSTALGANLSAATYKITGLGTPTASTDAATKQYVDDVAQGLHIHASAVAGTTANLTATYSNGTSGVGATLTNSGSLAAFSTDGVSPAQNDRVLVKNQTTQLQNGIYSLTTVGSASVAWVLTRVTDMDQDVEVDGGDFVFVTGGTTLDNTGWVQTEVGVVVGTNNIVFTQFSGAGTYTAGNGLTLNSNQFVINTGVTVDLSTAQTLTNKTLTSPTLTTPSIGVATGTSFNSITGLSSTTPVVDGTAAVGTATTVARADHVHPTPTSVVATVTGTNSTDLVYGNMADNDQFRIRVGGTATNAGFVELATADDGTEPIYVRQYSGVFTTLTRTATLLDGSGNTSFPGTVSASGLAGSLLTSTVGTNIGTASAGTSAIPARSDHVHPTTGLGLTASGLNQFAATTSAQLAGVISDETGSGALVFATSPTLVTPTLGVASATSINKVTITAPATGSTLTIAEGKTLTVSNTLTFNGTDASTVAFGTGGTVAYTNVATLSSLSSVGTITTGTWSGSFGAVSGANLTSLTAGNLSGTIPSGVLGNSTHYIGTTAIALNRASAAQALTGITSIDGYLTGTNTGRTGNIGLVTPAASSQATWSGYAIGYSAMLAPSANGAPNSTSYFYFNKTANRDSSGGWGGTAIDFASGDFYTGTAVDSTVYATWYKMAKSADVINNSLLTTTGDIIYASGASTPARLAAGTSGYVLTANGAGVAPSWQAAGGSGLDKNTHFAQMSLSGGGIVTWNGSSVKWSQRVIAIPVENTEFSANGYIDINCPTSGTVTYYNASNVTTTVTCTAAGIPLGPWESIYYQVTPGQASTSDQTKFRVVSYQNTTWSPTTGWILLATANGEGASAGGHLLWLPGQVNLPTQTNNTATYNVGSGETSWNPDTVMAIMGAY